MMKLNKICPVCSQAYKSDYPICEICLNEIKKYSYKEKCVKCGRAMNNNDGALCVHCKRLRPNFTSAFAVFPYKGDFKEAIRGAKFYDEYYRIRKLSELISEEFLKMNIIADCIIYVPTDIMTMFRRRYCLSQEIAYSVSKKLRIPVYKDFLFKKPNAKKQSLVGLDNRYTNIKNAFIKNPFTFKSINGKTVLLIDDVLTTGSTLSECADILKRFGARDVYGAALAYGSSNI